MLSPARLQPDSLLESLAYVQDEINGNFAATREPWRTQVHVLDEDSDGFRRYLLLEVPGWSDEVIRVKSSDLPGDVGETIEVGTRLHARVNVGAQKMDDLYFDEWEV